MTNSVTGAMETREASFDVEPSRDGRRLDGYVAVFNSRTRIPDRGGDFDEELKPGFADRSLRERMPIMQWDHGKDARVGTVPVGRWTEWRADGKGYRVRGYLLDNPVVEPVRQALAEGAINGLSFRFQVVKGGDKWERRNGGPDLRHVMDADVHEGGPVAFAAYKDARVSIRALMEMDVPILRSYDLHDAYDDDAQERAVEAYALTWTGISEQRGTDGSMVRARFDRHAFDEWLEEWRLDGKPPWPILRNHGDDGDPPVGHLIDAVADEYGLWTSAVFHDTDAGRAALRDIRSGELPGYSNHAVVILTDDAQDGVMQVRCAALVECGPVDKPADRGAWIMSIGGEANRHRPGFESIADVVRFAEIQTGRSTEELLAQARDEQRAKDAALAESLYVLMVFGREVAKTRRAAIETYAAWQARGLQPLLYEAQNYDRAEAALMDELRTLACNSTRVSPLGEDPAVQGVLDAAGAPPYRSPFRGRSGVGQMLALAGLGRR